MCLSVADNLLDKMIIFMQHNLREQHTIYESQDLIMKNKEIEVISINNL